MDDQFNRFDADARQALALAQHEAQQLGHNTIGTEHLLLGIAGMPDGVVARALLSEGVGLALLRHVVVATTGRRPWRSGAIALTPSLKRALADAVVEAEALHHTAIRPEHLMLGIIREGRGVALRVLASVGVEGTLLRAAILRGIAAPPGEPPLGAGEHPA